jgi:CheY-like chemotaxis protein
MERAMAGERILVVEDERIIAEDVCCGLKELGYSLLPFVDSGKEAIRIADEKKPDLVLMDIRLQGDMDGIEAAREIQSRMDIPVIYLSAYAEDALSGRMDMKKSSGYIPKPFSMLEIGVIVSLALATHKLITGCWKEARPAAKNK